MTSNVKAEIEDELRSVVQSMKEGIPLSKIQSDFRSLTGNVIPFGKFGYPSLEAMLKDMPSVVRLSRNGGGEIVVHAVANEATKHLTELISKQRSTKPRRVSKPRDTRRQHNWHPPPTPNRAYDLPSRPPSRNFRLLPFPRPPPRQPPPWLNPRYMQQLPEALPFWSDDFMPLQPLSSNVPSRNQDFDEKSNSRKPLPKTQALQKSKNLSKASSKPQQPKAGSEKKSAASRISPPENCPQSVPHPSSDIQNSLVPTKPDCSEPGLPWPDPKTSKQLVDNYAFINGLKCVYRPCENKNKRTRRSSWLSQLILDDQKFLSYPVEKRTPEEANEEAAKRAVEKLNITPNMVNLPVAQIESAGELESLKDNIKQIILESTQGIVHYYVQELYKRRHKKRLPENWLDLIQNTDLFRVERADDTHYILFYEDNSSASRKSPPAEESSLSDGSHTEAFPLPSLPEALPLPDSKNWGVYVTHTSSTANICFRLIDYADQFEEFAQSMEDYYSDKQNQKLARFPLCGVPCCVFVDRAWHRAIVQNISEDGMVLCDFPDVGDSEWLSPNALYELDDRFLEFPFQAFRADLAGLSCFAEDDMVSETLINLVIGKALIAEPTVRDDDNITLILYDTSTDEDININKMILQRIFSDIKAPFEPETGALLEGFLGNVLPTGIVQLQVMDRRTQLLNCLLENVSFLFETEVKENPVKEVSLTETCAVFYSNKWHRAVPASKDIASDKVSMCLIDTGKHIDASLKNICKLQGQTEIVASFPSLCVSCHLSGISNVNSFKWNSQATQKLQQLIPEKTPLLIKVSSTSMKNQLPVVELFKRIEPDMELVSINNTLVLHFSSSLFLEDSHAPSSPINKQEDIPEIEEYFDVFIASACKPNTFVCQSIRSRAATSKMFEEMQDFYNSEGNICKMHKALIHCGEFYALKYSDGCWYRVHIQEILDQEPFTMLVYLVDYGGFEIVKLCDVQILPKQFCQLKYQAISASLSGIEPAKSEYSPSDCLKFKNMVEEKCFVSFVKAKEKTNLNGLQGVHLNLILIDTSTPLDQYIDQELVSKGISKKV